MVEATLDSVRVPRQGKGRPKKRPRRTRCDKGYSYARCRNTFRRRGIGCLIPERQDERERRKKRGRKGGRPCRFDKQEYAGRNIVERCFLRLKQFRRVATRYDKLGCQFEAWVTLASIRLWLR